MNETFERFKLVLHMSESRVHTGTGLVLPGQSTCTRKHNNMVNGVTAKQLL